MNFSEFQILRLTIGSLAIGLGIPGNLIVIAVFKRQSVVNATDVALIALAVVDLVGSMISGAKILIVFFHAEHPWACFVEVFAVRSALYSSMFLTISIAAYRYQAVCNPFSKRIGPLAAVWISLILTLVAFALHVPFFFITKSEKLGDEYGCNVYGDIAWVRNVYARSQAVLFCTSALPVTVLYTLIYLHIRQHQAIRREILQQGSASKVAGGHLSKGRSTVPSVSSFINTSSAPSAVAMDESSSDGKAYPANQAKIGNTAPANQSVHERKSTAPNRISTTSQRQTDHKSTQMLVIITAVFFLLWLPGVVIDQLSFTQILRISTVIPKGTFLMYLLYQLKYISHIMNVFIYSAINRRFRHSCKKLFSL